MIKKIIYIYNAIKRYLFKDTLYLFLYLYRYFQKNYHNNCKFYTEEEFINLIKSGKSIIRIGDGEISLIHFLPAPPNSPQAYNDAIRKDYLKIIKNYSNDLNYVLMVPLFINYTNSELKKVNRFTHFRQLKITYELIFNKNAKYFDAHIFWRRGSFERLISPYIKNKKVIIVTNKENQNKIINSKLSSDEYLYVACEDRNAHDSRPRIQEEIVNLIRKSSLPKNNFVILMSAGPLKTMIYDMSRDGYQIIDIGRGLESYYAGVNIENSIINLGSELK